MSARFGGRSPADPVRRLPTAPRAVFWLTFALLSLVGAGWAAATPLMAGPDEPAHVIKAAAVVRGQWTADEEGEQSGTGWVEVPWLYAQAGPQPACFAYRPDVPADCAPGFSGDLDSPTAARTSAARYNPLYYLIAGAPTLIGNTVATLYAMRLVNAVLMALLAALAVRTLAEVRRPTWPVVGAAAGLTPMVAFLSGVVNPAGPEIAAALLVWSALLALWRGHEESGFRGAPEPSGPEATATRRWLIRLVVGAVLLANLRSLGPLFAVLAVAAVAATSPWRVVAGTFRSHAGLLAAGATTLAAGLSTAWVLGVGTLDTGPRVERFPQYAGTALVEEVLDRTSAYVRNTLGQFGWLDTPLPDWAYLLAAGPALLVILAGVASASWRQRVVLAAVALLVLALPFLAQLPEARYINLFWQGRYGLPLAIGVPLLAAFAIRRGDGIPQPATRRLAGTTLLLVGLVHTVAVAVNVQRYVNGMAGSWFSRDDPSWWPPVHPFLPVAGVGVAWLCLAALWATTGSAGHDDPAPAHSVAADPGPPAPPTATAVPPLGAPGGGSAEEAPRGDPVTEPLFPDRSGS